MKPVPLTPYARLPRAHRDLPIITSTVDAYGRAHWLLVERPDAMPNGPYDALVVTVDDGSVQRTHLSAVTAEHPLLDALPDGGFVLANARSPKHRHRDQVQIFDALGRPSWTFTVGDGVAHLLADEAGDLWIGYFDEGVLGDRLSAPGVRRWSSTGDALWEFKPTSGADSILDCYALNVDRRVAWAYTYTAFPLLEIRGDRPVKVRTSPVKGAHAIAVHGDRVAFFGGYGGDSGRLAVCALTESAAEPVSYSTLVRPEGGEIGHRRVVCRGPRVYVQDAPYTDWGVWDLSG
ncbi:hypothetical protein ACFYXH_33085 [Streptomyces sp. NPDC002730]|uniref:hypothetical protein n=1 Tax=Streptomyces sp. NPDC002730 TaxID=3364662 RepID=UPI0036744D99